MIEHLKYSNSPKKSKKGNAQYQDKKKTNNKTVDIYPTLSIIS